MSSSNNNHRSTAAGNTGTNTATTSGSGYDFLTDPTGLHQHSQSTLNELAEWRANNPFTTQRTVLPTGDWISYTKDDTTRNYGESSAMTRAKNEESQKQSKSQQSR
ncbi:uncharacterized protein I303_100892 [Kwoniella dejecticola CBS 10117]|uniref:Uncharacterized protein n=1 Tax=Kwoniella dejecticola CBS 10117 TaxID=1296121 RepID=A0A1A6AG86_9TREE|nr:uncharacterized protein I303_00896 [Kwoniella dejecticola CBS 10117]OBR89074.1 hypothetical protein I303_00896 [Kwoniella dejecticola CBS 10117]